MWLRIFAHTQQSPAGCKEIMQSHEEKKWYWINSLIREVLYVVMIENGCTPNANTIGVVKPRSDQKIKSAAHLRIWHRIVNCADLLLRKCTCTNLRPSAYFTKTSCAFGCGSKCQTKIKINSHIFSNRKSNTTSPSFLATNWTHPHQLHHDCCQERPAQTQDSHPSC